MAEPITSSYQGILKLLKQEYMSSHLNQRARLGLPYLPAVKR